MSREKVYGGVDVGLKGGVAFLKADGSILMKEAIPTWNGEVDIPAIFELLTTPWANNYETVHIVLEDVHSIFGSSAKSNFNFGLIKGVKIAFLEVLRVEYVIPYSLVQPKKWQSGVWTPEDIVMQEGTKRPTKDTKATSLKAAQRLWPGEDFTKSKRATTPHDGIVDALLMAEFCRTHL